MAPSSSASPAFPDPETRDAVRDGLAAAGYDEETICSRLGASSWLEIFAAPPAVVRHRVRGAGPTLEALLGLLRLGTGIPHTAAADVLGSGFLGALERAGLVEREGDRIRGTVTLTPMGRLLVASDLRERHAARAADFVLGPGGVTRLLADLTLPGRLGSVLDLGCGAGVLGALTAGRAQRVVATDVNPRAVAFSRFNAKLNALDHMTCRAGSLFEPVRGERFDLILCNPPYVISPESTFTYRDGGTALCRAIVQDATEHLTDGGTLQMLAEWPQRSDSDWRAEVGSWLEGVACDAWVLRVHTFSVSAYASTWLEQEHGREAIPAEAFARWVEYLEGLGIESVGGGLIVLRRSARSTPLRVMRAAPPIVPPTGPSLDRWLRGHELLAGLEDEAALLDVPLVPSDGLERREIQSASGAGWSGTGPILRVTRGLTFGVRVDPVATELVGWLDGRRTAREAMALVAAGLGVEVEPFLAGLPGALSRLIALGILHPVRDDGSA